MFSAGKLELLAQDFQQGLVYWGQDLDYFAIEVQVEDVLHAALLYSPQQI
jgi:hypothetical protein